jgi:uncharacterized membrane protein YfcA
MRNSAAWKKSMYFLLGSLALFLMGVWMAHRHSPQTIGWMALAVVFLVLGARKPEAKN